MFEEDLLEEEIQKKKRRVLFVLLGMLLVGAAVALPLTELSPPPATQVSEAVETPGRAVTVPAATLVPTGAAGGEVMPGGEAGTAGPAESTPQPTATGAGTVSVATEDAAGGAGGGTLDTPAATAPGTAEWAAGGAGDGTPDAALTATGTPVGGTEPAATPTPAGGAGGGGTPSGPAEATPQATATTTAAPTAVGTVEATPAGAGEGTPVGAPAATSTPGGPAELPASGAGDGLERSRLAWGLVAVWLGAVLALVGYALRRRAA